MIMARPPRALTPAEIDHLSLSDREVEVLYLIAAGCTTAEVASTLYLSVNSVKTHTQSLFKKLGVTSRLQAAVWVWSRTVDPVPVPVVGEEVGGSATMERWIPVSPQA